MATAAVRAFFSRNPTLANMVVYSSLYGGAEFTQQTLQGRPRYDWMQVGRLALSGGAVFAPLYTQWYRRLDVFLPGKATRTVAIKVFLDQAIMGCVGACLFFSVVTGLEGKSAEDCRQEVVAKAPRAWVTGFAFWPFAQMFNFRFLPTHLRAGFVACCAFGWTNFLCYLKSKDITDTLHIPQPVEVNIQSKEY